MKGCLAIFGVFAVLMILLGGGCVGYTIYQGNQMAERTEAGKKQLDALDAKYAFAPTSDAKLEPARFERFVKVRGVMVAKVQKAFDDLHSLGKDGDVGFWEMMKKLGGAVKGLANMTADSPAQLAALLDQEQMSFKEYRWATSRMHGTLIAAADAGNAEAQAVNDAFTRSLEKLNQPQSNDGAAKLRAELGAAYTSADPQELALILSKKDLLLPESAGFLVDIVTLDIGKDQAAK